jgi:hypothetical protein
MCFGLRYSGPSPFSLSVCYFLTFPSIDKRWAHIIDEKRDSKISIVAWDPSRDRQSKRFLGIRFLGTIWLRLLASEQLLNICISELNDYILNGSTPRGCLKERVTLVRDKNTKKKTYGVNHSRLTKDTTDLGGRIASWNWQENLRWDMKTTREFTTSRLFGWHILAYLGLSYLFPLTEYYSFYQPSTIYSTGRTPSSLPV